MSRKVLKKQEKRTILIVDYDKSTARTFKQIVERQGYFGDIAEDSEEAIEKIKNNTYDAALINFVLPDMDGLDLLLFTRRIMPNAADIITVGFPSLGNGIRAVDFRPAAYFSKPIQPKELIHVIEEKFKLQEEKSGKRKRKQNLESAKTGAY